MSDPRANLVTRDVVLVLTINAEQVRGDEITTELEAAFTTEVDRAGATKVVVNMAAVSYITSIGVRALLGLHHKLKDVGGRVVLCGLSEMVSEVLHVVRFIDPSGLRPAPFAVQADVTAAAVSLLSPRSPRQ